MVTGNENLDNGDLEEAAPPFLRRVRLQGYKSIAFCDVLLAPLTILVGRNASGKSNFLDALAFVQDALETNIPEAVRKHGGWSSIDSRSSEGKRICCEVEVGFTWGRDYARVDEPFSKANPFPAASGLDDRGKTFVAVYGFEIKAGAKDVPLLECEYLRFVDEMSDAAFGFEIHRGQLSQRGKRLAPSNGPLASGQLDMIPYRADRLFLSAIGTQPFIDIAEGLRSMGFYNFHPDAIRQLQKPDPGAMLKRDGKNLASLIESVREIDEATVRRVGAYLSAIVEEVERFEVVRYGEYETIRFHLRNSNSANPLEFDAASMSDGTLRTLASLMAAFQIHLPFGPSVVGIEEPETALHPAAMQALVDALDEATLRTQILLTTHSADMLDNPTIRPANIRVVQMIDAQTVIAPMDEASVDIVRRKLNTLGGLERDNLLEPDLDDLDRQHHLGLERQESPA